jgi:integrase
MILLAYRRGLRAAELVDLQWDQIDFGRAAMHVHRVKQGSPATHPLRGDELRALRRLQREQEPLAIRIYLRAWSPRASGRVHGALGVLSSPLEPGGEELPCRLVLLAQTFLTPRIGNSGRRGRSARPSRSVVSSQFATTLRARRAGLPSLEKVSF